MGCSSQGIPWGNSYEMIRTTPTGAWKGHDFDVLNDLNDEDMIWQEEHPSHSKYVYLTDAGVQYAKKLMDKYGIKER